jgi:hypothetical protein
MKPYRNSKRSWNKLKRRFATVERVFNKPEHRA